MPAFDESKPYGTVRGRSGIKYEQDGRFFNARKEQVDADGQPPKSSGKPTSDDKSQKPARRKAPSKQETPEGVKSMADLAQEDEQ